MFYAFTTSKKWKERRFQPYFNNKCMNFYLLTDTCTNFPKCSLWFFFDLSGFVGLMMKAYFTCKKISSLLAQLQIVWCLHQERGRGQTFKVTRVYYKSGSHKFNYFSLQKPSKLPKLSGSIQGLLWVKWEESIQSFPPPLTWRRSLLYPF